MLPPWMPPVPDGRLTFRKVDAVFKSGNQTRDDIPSHLIIGEDVMPEMAEMLENLCPAGVYERDGEKLVVNAPNCVDCKLERPVGTRRVALVAGAEKEHTRRGCGERECPTRVGVHPVDGDPVWVEEKNRSAADRSGGARFEEVPPDLLGVRRGGKSARQAECHEGRERRRPDSRSRVEHPTHRPLR